MNPRAGQIWAYDSQANTLPLVVESESKDMPEAPDDFTLGPDERLYLY